MWAQRLVRPGGLESIEVAAPVGAQLRPGQVLLRSLAGGICGSDLPKFRGIKGATTDPHGEFSPGRPGFPLHEIVGEAVASRYSGVEEGQCVVGWAKDSAGLAEFVVAEGDSVTPYNTGIAAEEAVIIQPLACVLYALERIPIRGKRVAILGLGPFGCLFSHVAKAHGASSVTGIDTVDRTEFAAAFSFDDLLTSSGREWGRQLKNSLRPDVVIEAVGHQTETLRDAIIASGAEGTILYFGIPDEDVYPVNMELVMRKNLTIVGGVVRERLRSLHKAHNYLLQNPSLPTGLVTHRFTRAGTQQAFDMAAKPKAGQLKIVLALDR